MKFKPGQKVWFKCEGNKTHIGLVLKCYDDDICVVVSEDGTEWICPDEKLHPIIEIPLNYTVDNKLQR